VGYLDAIAHLAGKAPEGISCSIRTQPEQATKQLNEEAERKRKINSARAAWERRRPITGTVADHYLRLRGLAIDEDLSHYMGFDPEAYWREIPNNPASALLRVPCLLAIYRDIQSDEIIAVQKTRLANDASKIGRRFNGCPKGAVIKIDADENVTIGLGLGEGLETCLSARAFGFRPVWAAGSTGAIETFPVLGGIEALTLFLEHDENGANARAVDICTRRWLAAGKQVFHAVPPMGFKDLNDVSQKRIARA